jgi:hypothetical protein
MHTKRIKFSEKRRHIFLPYIISHYEDVSGCDWRKGMLPKGKYSKKYTKHTHELIQTWWKERIEKFCFVSCCCSSLVSFQFTQPHLHELNMYVCVWLRKLCKFLWVPCRNCGAGLTASNRVLLYGKFRENFHVCREHFQH